MLFRFLNNEAVLQLFKRVQYILMNDYLKANVTHTGIKLK